ncbi:MAG: PIG-L family deacetylase [Rudaea sp.]
MTATMPNPLQLAASDRVLVFAPHPDDESIACAGLLLAARVAGATRSVVVVTDGDNNPWPQRWIEKRWRIDAAARTRWGARRRAEACAALDILGVDPTERHFLGLPDSGLTALLMRDGLSNRLRAQIERFRPTHIALPALRDRHPDHSAVHVAARLALASNAQTRLFTYAIHGGDDGAHDAVVRLDEAARADKRAAILEHETQIRLSRGRFLRFAAQAEYFDNLATGPRADHPLRAWVGDGEVVLRLTHAGLRDATRALRVFAVIDTQAGECLRLVLPLGEPGGEVAVDAAQSQALSSSRWGAEDGALVLRLPVSAVAGRAFFKLDRRRTGLVIYDRYGWQLGDDRNAHLGKV